MTAVAISDDQAGAILARAAAGDELAFTRLVAAHHADMRRVAYVVTPRRRFFVTFDEQ